MSGCLLWLPAGVGAGGHTQTSKNRRHGLSKHDTFLLRIDPAILKAVKQWAADELRSANGQIEFLLREALQRTHRLPGRAGAEGNGSAAAEEAVHAESSSDVEE